MTLTAELTEPYTKVIEQCDNLYGEIEGAPGNVLDAASGNTHDFLAAFIVSEIVSACEGDGLESGSHSDRIRAVKRGLQDAADILSEMASSL